MSLCYKYCYSVQLDPGRYWLNCITGTKWIMVARGTGRVFHCAWRGVTQLKFTNLWQTKDRSQNNSCEKFFTKLINKHNY